MSLHRLLLPFALLWPLAAFPQAAPADGAKETVIVIPHTHWEGAVFKTRSEYLDIGLPHILKALNLLKRYPDYRFVLDQMCYVKPFLERYPAEADAFRKFVREGRLDLTGGTDTMHDSNMVSGESIVRQYLLGKQFFRDRLDVEVKSGWGLDTFGHNAQMPQILKLAGMNSYWFQRGVPGPQTPSEFLWEGIDGTRIAAFWLPISYAALHNLPSGAADFDRLIRGRVDALAPFARGRGRVLMAGADVWEPEELLPVMVAQFNRASEAPFTLRLGVPSDYETLAAARKDETVIRGELNPIYQGAYSSRIEVKQWNRNLERILTMAEKTSVLAGDRTANSRRAIEEAWEPVLFNQAHDLASGVMVDKVFEDCMSGFHHAKRLADGIVERNLDALSAKIDTSGAGVPLVVFNMLGWPRTDFVEAEVALTDPGVQNLALLDPAGKPVPIQVLRSERNGDGGLRLAVIGFVAHDVPALGYSVYRAVSRTPGMAVPAGASYPSSPEPRYSDVGSIENEFYRATFHLWNGEMTSLVLKDGNWEVLSGPGNVVAREEDGGDFWELYGTLNDGRFTNRKRQILAPRPHYSVFSNDFTGGGGAARNGPVMSEFRISHPFGKNHFSTRVRMYAGVRRIDIRTEITNTGQFVRYRVAFPTAIRAGRNVQEIPFGAIERPSSQEFPAQNWSDLSAGSRGLTLLNRGLPGNNVVDGTMLLSLMRSARLISYGYSGGYEPGVSSDSGLEVGKRLAFDYALVPHTGDWRDAAAYRAGLEFNHPLIARTAAPHPGVLPKVRGLLSVTPEQIVISAVKPSRDGRIAVRVYEPTGLAVKGARLRFTIPIAHVREANLLEDPGRAVAVQGNAFSFDLWPFEIKTFLLE
ncbi:MAG: glycosyl hydrolase-related protein [Acidobacteriales bacterium]|nr:glycosyl hydrolase-related protein [Terriglobales bacterium]